MRSQLIAVKN